MHTKKDVENINHLGFRSFIKKAIDLGVDVHFYKNHRKLIRLSCKGKTVYANENKPPLSAQMGRFTISKKVTKTILNENNISVPRGISAKTAKEAIKKMKNEKLQYPLILKPIDGSLAKGITWNITSQKELRAAVHFLKEEQKKYKFMKRSRFLVEEMFFGDEYRVLVLKNKVISCVKKIPATVIGDGKSTIQELIKKQNKKRLKGYEIKLDKEAKQSIEKAGFTMGSVLPESHNLRLRNDMMLFNGGRSVDCTDMINQSLQKDCVRAVQSLGLEFGGIDLLSKDITKSKNYTIIEINRNPVYVINEKPLVEGKGVDVSHLILQEVFPQLKK